MCFYLQNNCGSLVNEIIYFAGNLYRIRHPISTVTGLSCFSYFDYGICPKVPNTEGAV